MVHLSSSLTPANQATQGGLAQAYVKEDAEQRGHLVRSKCPQAEAPMDKLPQGQPGVGSAEGTAPAENSGGTTGLKSGQESPSRF
mmetsp:Transcript_20044/g.55795  ORF Transcript_20044/g.55795 Transcript_20044/m.55795 type:complete len:85 (+) Transcript_20044:469-723(+)